MFMSGVRGFALGCALLFITPSTFAAITLELRPTSQTVTAGTSANVELYVVSDVAGGEPVGIVDAILLFDPARLTLLGQDLTGAPAWGSAVFSSSSPLNPDWTDGDAFFTVSISIIPMPCGIPVMATPAGLLITTFQFDVGSTIGTTSVALPASLGTDTTAVLDALTALNCPGVPYVITRGPAALLNVVTCASAADCNDGTACTDDICTAGVCSNPNNFDAATQCCNPADGLTITISDSNDCTRDLCSALTGQVSHTNENFGVACGDTSNTSCTNPDFCNGMGVCLSNDQTNGIPCAEQSQCIADGTCQSGVCSNPTAFSADGTTCDDSINCTELDVCTAGVCGGTNPCSGVLPICFENVGGFICGNCTSRSQCPNDFGCITWDCLSFSHICAKTQDDVLCDDMLFCTGDDACQSDGTCTNTGSPCLTGALCDEANVSCIECVVDTDCKRCDLSGIACLDTVDCPAGETCLPQSDLCDPIVCNAGLCEPGVPVVCTQTDQCLINSCNPTTGACELNIPDQVACTVGSCPIGFSCNTQAGFCFGVAGCSDGDGCTLFDQCINGICVGNPRLLDGNIEMKMVLDPPLGGGSFYAVGETIGVRLELSIDAAVSTTSRFINIVEAAMLWNPMVIGGVIAPTINDPCVGVVDPVVNCPTGQYDWSTSGSSAFSNISDGAELNLNLIDGDAFYFAAVGLGQPRPEITVLQNLWVTTFQFVAVGATSSTGSLISLDTCVGKGDGTEGSNSRVISGLTERTGQLLDANVIIQCTVNSQCNDDDPCTVDSCNQSTSFCQFLGDATLAGVACGDGTSSDCDNPNTCDAFGVCQSNNVSNGVACTDDGIDCTDDVCSNAACTHPNKSIGIACGDATNIECNAPDTCDGIGNCLSNITGDGTACSSDGNDCTVDACQFGLCLHNDQPDGTSCDDFLFCTELTTCGVGICQGGQAINCDDTFACTTDTCDDNTNACVHTPSNASCSDGMFCNGDEICNVNTGCVAGSPRNCDDGIICTNDFCNDSLAQCDHIADDSICDDGLFCNGQETCDLILDCQASPPVNCSDDGIACTVNDFCDEGLDACTGVPNDGLCAQNEICDAILGCVLAVTCDPPVVSAVGTRYFSIEPLPIDGTVPTRFFVTSPTWPCLAKFVGDPIAVDLDNNGSIDGMAAKLVDVVNAAGELTPLEWTGSACNNFAPVCSVDSDCGVGGSCQPIMRCNDSLVPCVTNAQCILPGETCQPGKLYVTGQDITPSERNVAPTEYRVQADCGGNQTPPQSVQMLLYGDSDGSGIVSSADIVLAVLGFQLKYHQPEGEPNSSTKITLDHRGTANICNMSLPPAINTADITSTIKSFQLRTYAQGAFDSECSLPCP